MKKKRNFENTGRVYARGSNMITNATRGRTRKGLVEEYKLSVLCELTDDSSIALKDRYVFILNTFWDRDTQWYKNLEELNTLMCFTDSVDELMSRVYDYSYDELPNFDAVINDRIPADCPTILTFTAGPLVGKKFTLMELDCSFLFQSDALSIEGEDDKVTCDYPKPVDPLSLIMSGTTKVINLVTDEGVETFVALVPKKGCAYNVYIVCKNDDFSESNEKYVCDSILRYAEGGGTEPVDAPIDLDLELSDCCNRYKMKGSTEVLIFRCVKIYKNYAKASVKLLS